MAYSAPSTRSAGDLITTAIWNADLVANEVAINAGAVAIASQATGDVIVASSATQLGRVAPGTSGNVLTSTGSAWGSTAPAATAIASQCDHRLTLTSGLAVTTADVTGASTIYLTPYKGKSVALYTGSAWVVYTVAELSISTSGGSASKPHDVFLDENGGTPALAILTWTNGTTRATALTVQDGVLVKTGDTSQRYMGTVYLDGSKNCSDAALFRNVWNYSHRVSKRIHVYDTADSWTYATDTIRQANGNAANKAEITTGGIGDATMAQLNVRCYLSSGTIASVIGFGVDATTAFSASSGIAGQGVGGSGTIMSASISYTPTVGHGYLAWLENTGAGGGTVGFAGDDGGLRRFGFAGTTSC